MRMLMPELDVDRENTVFISGMDVPLRPYMNTYGMHGIHGRAPATPQGWCGETRPRYLGYWRRWRHDVNCGNHLIHALRRNVNIKILLFNNMIYGPTKG